MNIAHAFKMIKPQIITKVKESPVSIQTLKKVFDAISDGFNMTNKKIAKITGLSIGCIGNAAHKLYESGNLSRINLRDGKGGFTYAYTAIKPLRGDL